MEKDFIENAAEPVEDVVERREIDFDSIDWQTFDISFAGYFNGDDDYTSDEYEQILKFVNAKCSESGEYIVDCYNNRYSVRTKAEAEQLRLDAMSAEEKAALLSEQKRFERNRLLAATDKLMLPDYPITESEREQYKQYREYLRDLPEAEDFPNVEVLSFADWQKPDAAIKRDTSEEGL